MKRAASSDDSEEDIVLAPPRAKKPRTEAAEEAAAAAPKGKRAAAQKVRSMAESDFSDASEASDFGSNDDDDSSDGGSGGRGKGKGKGKKPEKKAAAAPKKAAAKAKPAKEEEEGGGGKAKPPRVKKEKDVGASPLRAKKELKIEEVKHEAGASFARNRLLAELVDIVAKIRKDEDKKWEAIALTKAAEALRCAEEPIVSGKQASNLKGIGKGTAALIDEYLSTGAIAATEERLAVDRPLRVALELAAALPGVEVSALRTYVQEFGVANVGDVLALARDRPELFASAVLPFLRHYADAVLPTSSEAVAALEAALPGLLTAAAAALPTPHPLQGAVLGHYRRGKPNSAHAPTPVLITSPDYLCRNPAHPDRVDLKVAQFPVLDRLAGVLREAGILAKADVTEVRLGKGDDHFTAFVRVPGAGEAVKREVAEPGSNLVVTAGTSAPMPSLEEAAEEAPASPPPAAAPRAVAAPDASADVFGGLEVPDLDAVAAAEAAKSTSGRLVTHAKGAGGAMKADPGAVKEDAAASSSSSGGSYAERTMSAAPQPEGYFLARFQVVPANTYGFYTAALTGPPDFFERVKGSMTAGKAKKFEFSKSAWLPLVEEGDPIGKGGSRMKFAGSDEDDDGAPAAGKGKPAKMVASREGLPCFTEEEWFQQTGIKYIPPSER